MYAQPFDRQVVRQSVRPREVQVALAYVAHMQAAGLAAGPLLDAIAWRRKWVEEHGAACVISCEYVMGVMNGLKPETQCRLSWETRSCCGFHILAQEPFHMQHCVTICGRKSALALSSPSMASKGGNADLISSDVIASSPGQMQARASELRWPPCKIAIPSDGMQ